MTLICNTSHYVGVVSESKLSTKWKISICTCYFNIQPPHSYSFHDHRRPWGFYCVGRCRQSSSTPNRWIFDSETTELTIQVIDLLVVVSVFVWIDGFSRDGEWKLKEWGFLRIFSFFFLPYKCFHWVLLFFYSLSIYSVCNCVTTTKNT